MNNFGGIYMGIVVFFLDVFEDSVDVGKWCLYVLVKIFEFLLVLKKLGFYIIFFFLLLV